MIFIDLAYSFFERKKAKKINTVIKMKLIPRDLNYGAYSLLGKKTHISNNVRIGKFSYFNSNQIDIIIESNSIIGCFCSIAPGVMIGLGNHYSNLVTTHPILFNSYYIDALHWNNIKPLLNGLSDDNLSTIIGSDVWIGTRANIKRGIKIGNGAIVAAESVVTKNVPNYAIVAGVPAKIIGYRFEKKIIEILNDNEQFCFWNWDESTLNKYFESLYDSEDYILAIEKVKYELDQSKSIKK